MDLQSVLGWAGQNTEMLITIGSALVALVSALAARGETRAQRQLQQGAVRVEIDRQSLTWGDEVIDTMAMAGALATATRSMTEQDFSEQRDMLAAKLSALGDRGRLFFPNYAPGTKGEYKEGAYKGHRPPILFAVIMAHYQVKLLEFGHLKSGQAAGDYLFQLRRLFVSELQGFLDPAHRNSLVERSDRMEDRPYLHAARLALDFDCRYPGVLLAHNDQDLLLILSDEERKAFLHAFNQKNAP